LVRLVGIGFFFFSSRRRHTRWPRDWSSDVCSSDLVTGRPEGGRDLALDLLAADAFVTYAFEAQAEQDVRGLAALADRVAAGQGRSEERRVGKECRAGWLGEQ